MKKFTLKNSLKPAAALFALFFFSSCNKGTGCPTWSMDASSEGLEYILNLAVSILF